MADLEKKHSKEPGSGGLFPEGSHCSEGLERCPPLTKLQIHNLNMIAARTAQVGQRLGLLPYPANFNLKSDQQIADDAVYNCMPRHYPHWRYGKSAMQMRRQNIGHIFEFALTSNPAEIALGETNDLVMQMDVIVHAWLGHIDMDRNNFWFRETEPESVLQKFAQDERFIKSLIADTENWGWERYEHYMDAVHSLEMHSGWLPTKRDLIPDNEHRQLLKSQLTELKARYDKAKTKNQRETLYKEIEDTALQLSCHPIVPTDDILGFLAEPENTKHLPDEARKLISIGRENHRYFQTIMRTKYMHEGWSHFWDEYVPVQPDMDLVGLGMGNMIDHARYNTMHDAYPLYWYFDFYALGQRIWKYIDKTTSKYLGKEKVKYKRWRLNKEGKIVWTGKYKEVEVDKYDRSYMYEVRRTFNDRRFFETFLTEEFYAELNKEALDWVRDRMRVINGILKDQGWNPALIHEPVPETLEEMYFIVNQWMSQSGLDRMAWSCLGYGGPPFPIHPMVLYQMLQIIQIAAAYDQDKNEVRRYMLMRTDLTFMPNIRIVDTGKYNKSGTWTLRHEFDPDFGPLKQGYARQTLRNLWRLCGEPVRLLTWEHLTDWWGRPYGPARPYEYSTDNGETVKELWL